MQKYANRNEADTGAYCVVWLRQPPRLRVFFSTTLLLSLAYIYYFPLLPPIQNVDGREHQFGGDQ